MVINRESFARYAGQILPRPQPPPLMAGEFRVYHTTNRKIIGQQ